MTAPMSLREYFAAVGSPFTKEQAAVIGPQIEAMAEEGILDTKDERAAAETIVEVARSENHPLHSNAGFIWDDARAAHIQRVDHARTMLKSIRVRYVEENRPRTTPAYRIVRPQQKATFARGHNVLHGESAAAVQKAKQSLDELTSWRARYQPFVTVWKDFARVFSGVANQISEGEDELSRMSSLDEATDEALTDMGAIQSACSEWQQKHGGTVKAWEGLSDQVAFTIEAIDAASAAFHIERPMERKCLGCGKSFQSAGISNRLCVRCSTRSLPERGVLT